MKLSTFPKILITGANGYIGSNLAYNMLKEGFDVRTSDLSDNSLVKGVEYVQCDFTDAHQIANVIKDIDYIYFFTGKTGNSEEAFDNPDNFIVGNELTLVNLLNVLKSEKIKPRIIFPSTRLMYKGGEAIPLDENAETEAKCIYAVNKIACESYLHLYQINYGIDYTIFRISLPYGSNVEMGHVSYGVMAYLINRARNGNELLIYGNGAQKGSLIHINDLSKLLIQGGMHSETKNQIFNIGGPDHLEIGETVKSISKHFDVQFKHTEWPGVFQSTDQGHLIINSKKLIGLLNYKYKYQFQEWLNQLKA